MGCCATGTCGDEHHCPCAEWRTRPAHQPIVSCSGLVKNPHTKTGEPRLPCRYVGGHRGPCRPPRGEKPQRADLKPSKKARRDLAFRKRDRKQDMRKYRAAQRAHSHGV
jgi:hypothetical protein